MEVVNQFLEARRKGDVSAALGYLEPTATLAGPWGYQNGEAAYTQFLNDEKKFLHRQYLEPVPIKQVAPDTYQRMFEYDKGMTHHHFGRSHYGNTGFGPLDYFLKNYLPLLRPCGYYREVYWIKDDKVRMVTCFRQP